MIIKETLPIREIGTKTEWKNKILILNLDQNCRHLESKSCRSIHYEQDKHEHEIKLVNEKQKKLP